MDPKPSRSLRDVSVAVRLHPFDVRVECFGERWRFIHVDIDRRSDVEPPKDFACSDRLVDDNIGTGLHRNNSRFGGQVPADDRDANVGLLCLHLANERYARTITQMQIDDREIKSMLRRELSCIADARRGCYIPFASKPSAETCEDSFV